MIALSSLNDLNKTQMACNQIKAGYPDLFEKLIHLISLTRQLQFRYHYMACLITGEDASMYTPKHTRDSVMDLYHDEINRIKAFKNSSVLKQLFIKHKNCGYNNISLLALGRSPEYLKGIIK